MKSNENEITDSEELRLIYNIFKLIIQKNNLHNLRDWKFIYIKDNLRDIMCLPDGTLIIYEGFIDSTHEIDEYTLGLAHEISHCLLRHQSREFSKYFFFNSFLIFYIEYFLNNNASSSHTFMKSISLYKRYSNKLEKEADELSLKLISNAGFGTIKAIKLFDNLENHKYNDSFLNKHKANMIRKDTMKNISKELNIVDEPKKGYLETIDEYIGLGLFWNIYSKMSYSYDTIKIKRRKKKKSKINIKPKY